MDIDSTVPLRGTGRQSAEEITHVVIGSTRKRIPIADVTTIGRLASCSLHFLTNLTVSRLHCSIYWREATLWLQNHSAHGTMVNGVWTERGQLTAGDRVQIGDEELFFLGKSGRVRVSGKPTRKCSGTPFLRTRCHFKSRASSADFVNRRGTNIRNVEFPSIFDRGQMMSRFELRPVGAHAIPIHSSARRTW